MADERQKQANIVAHRRPNHALEPTLGRREISFEFMKQFFMFAALGYPKGGSAFSR